MLIRISTSSSDSLRKDLSNDVYIAYAMTRYHIGKDIQMLMLLGDLNPQPCGPESRMEPQSY